MKENVFHLIEERVKKIEQTQSLEDFVIGSTNSDEQHRMKIEEDYSSVYDQLGNVYQELSDLELADLEDYKNLVGRFDGEFN